MNDKYNLHFLKTRKETLLAKVTPRPSTTELELRARISILEIEHEHLNNQVEQLVELNSEMQTMLAVLDFRTKDLNEGQF